MNRSKPLSTLKLFVRGGAGLIFVEMLENHGKSGVSTPLVEWLPGHPIVRLPFGTLCPIVEKLVDKNQKETFRRFYMGLRDKA